MDGWRQQLSGCWQSVAVQLPQLQSSLSQLGQGWLGSLGGGATGAAGQEYDLNGRRLRVVRQLGEGGYSFVYLVRQVAQAPPPAAADSGGGGGRGVPAAAAASAAAATHGTGTQQMYALKRVLCGGREQLAEAQHEVAVLRRLAHPCLLPLLDAGVQQQQQQAPEGGGDGSRRVVLMLFPVYDEGNLWDFIQRQQEQQRQRQRRHTAGSTAARHLQQQQEQQQQLRLLLQVFLQVCAALHSMHSMDPPLAHRDVKPQNVLLRRRQPASSGGGDRQQQQQQQQGSKGSSGAYVPSPEGQQQEEEEEWEAAEWQNSSAGSGERDGSSSSQPAAAAGAAVIAVEQEGQHQQQEGQQWWQQRLEGWREQYEVVLMDFGSTRTAEVAVRNRSEAMAVQEDAERQCTAPYRAPELWDVPSTCTIDERVDVWSLGCLLYYMLCGQSPFERVAGEAGGSLMLAVVNGRLSWPSEAAGAAAACPASLKQLVSACLDTDPATRPAVAQVAARADRILAALSSV